MLPKITLFAAIVVIGTLIFSIPPALQAQESDPTLSPFQSVTGTLNEENLSDDWSLEGHTGNRISFVVETLSGNLDPILILLDENGQEIASNDNADSTTLNARLESITLPTQGIYTVQVAREGLAQGSTSGDYQLVFFSGYSVEIAPDSAEASLLLAGGEFATRASFKEIPVQDFMLLVDVTMPSAERPYTLEWRFNRFPDSDLALAFYIQTDGSVGLGFTDEQGRLISGAESRYPYDIVPPAGGNATFIFSRQANRLSVQVSGTEILVFDIPEATVVENSPLEIVIRGNLNRAADQSLRLILKNFHLTTPYYLSDPVTVGAVAPTPPGKRFYNYTASPLEIVRELRALDLVKSPGGGIQAQFRDAYIFNDDVGFNAFPLVAQQTFRNFVLGYSASVLQGNPDTACGIIFRQADAANFATVVFTPNNQLYFLEYQGGEVNAGSLAVRSGVVFPGLRAKNHFVIVVEETTGALYVNGRLIGEIRLRAVRGGLAVHMVLTEIIPSYCLLEGGWVWSLD